MRIVKLGLVIAASVVVSSLLLAIAAYAIAGQPAKGAVAPRVFLGDRQISRLPVAQLDAVLSDFAVDYENEPLTIEGGGRKSTIDSAAIKVRIDQAATKQNVLDVGRSGSYPSDVLSFLGSFFEARRVPIDSSFDRAALDALLVTQDPGARTPPTEPHLEFREGRMVPVEGETGVGITAETVAEVLPDALQEGKPLEVEPDRGAVVPTMTWAEAVAATDQLNQRLSSVPVRVGDVSGTLNLDRYGPWIRTSVANRQFDYAIEIDPAVDLQALIPETTVAPLEPRFVVNGGQPTILAPVNGQKCCDTGAFLIIDTELEAYVDGLPLAAPISLPAVTVPASKTVADLEALRVTHRIATFTSGHPAGQPRVTNIHRMADTVRGHVIEPGQTMSLNAVVGPRTLDKGYVVDAVINEAKFAQSVGGGVSQFATALFNAAFFGGLDFGEYQSHSIYIDRYPYGREATISHPHPDLQIKNTTPYGVLVWPTYTRSSITVDLYSTPHAEGAQTGQSETKVGPCTRVRTERTRSYGDGRKSVDAVYALYQPAEGVKC